MKSVLHGLYLHIEELALWEWFWTLQTELNTLQGTPLHGSRLGRGKGHPMAPDERDDCTDAEL